MKNKEEIEKSFIRASQKHQSGDYKEAIEDYDKAIALDPNYTNAYFNKAIFLHALNKKEYKEEIIKCFDKVISIQEEPKKPLYKYIPINNYKLLSLLNSEVYFCDYTQLNDPLAYCILKADNAKWFQ